MRIKNFITITEIDRELEKRYAELKHISEQLLHEIEKFPPGKICIAKSPTRIQYYVRKRPTDKTGEYLGADKQELIKVYMQKAYNESVLKLINQEIDMLEKFIAKHEPIQNDIRNKFSDLPTTSKKYVCPVDASDEDFASWWSSISFEGKRMPSSKLEFVTDRGEYVRSKSELMIANMLNKYHIPYKYECRLDLRNGVVIYPDFTTLNVPKRKLVYWEHRGLLDDREYAKYSVKRMKDYGDSGILLGRDLIVTEETSTSPLSTREILRVINDYLL